MFPAQYSLFAPWDLSAPDMKRGEACSSPVWRQCTGWTQPMEALDFKKDNDFSFIFRGFETLIMEIPDSVKWQMPGDSRLENADHQAGIWADNLEESKSTCLVKNWQVSQSTHEAIADQGTPWLPWTAWRQVGQNVKNEKSWGKPGCKQAANIRNCCWQSHCYSLFDFESGSIW